MAMSYNPALDSATYHLDQAYDAVKRASDVLTGSSILHVLYDIVEAMEKIDELQESLAPQQ